MKNLILALILTAAAVTAQAEYTEPTIVSFEWSQPSKYIDLDHNGYGVDSLNHFSKEIRAYANRVAENVIPKGHTLRIVVKNMDLAGEREAWHKAPYKTTRVLRQGYPPSMNVEFIIYDADRKQIKKGQKVIVGKLAISQVTQRVFANDNYFYEKEMIGNWLRQLSKDTFHKS